MKENEITIRREKEESTSRKSAIHIRLENNTGFNKKEKTIATKRKVNLTRNLNTGASTTNETETLGYLHEFFSERAFN